jgi:hypothetical protein
MQSHPVLQLHELRLNEFNEQRNFLRRSLSRS